MLGLEKVCMSRPSPKHKILLEILSKWMRPIRDPLSRLRVEYEEMLC